MELNFFCVTSLGLKVKGGQEGRDQNEATYEYQNPLSKLLFCFLYTYNINGLKINEAKRLRKLDMNGK